MKHSINKVPIINKNNLRCQLRGKRDYQQCNAMDDVIPAGRFEMFARRTQWMTMQATVAEFHDAVNMSVTQLETWLATDEGQDEGQKNGGNEIDRTQDGSHNHLAAGQAVK